MLGLPEGQPWIWLLLIAPAIQVLTQADQALNLSQWIMDALAQWRLVTHRLWQDLFAWLNLHVPLDAYELDGLTLSSLCLAAALGSLVRGQHAPLQTDLRASSTLSLPHRLIFHSVLASVATCYFLAFVGGNILTLNGPYLEGLTGIRASHLMIAACATGAVGLVALLFLATPLLTHFRIEAALALLVFLIGWVLILGMAWLMGFDAAQLYLDQRGLGWGAYAAMILAISIAVYAVLRVNWRVLPAILLLAGIVILGDKVAKVMTPLAEYLNSLLI